MTIRSLCARVLTMWLVAVGLWACPSLAYADNASPGEPAAHAGEAATSDVTPLYMGVAEAINGAARSFSYFSITVPAGTAGLRVRTFNGAGTLDLFVSRDVLPTRSMAMCPYANSPTSYVCEFAPAVAGTYYVLVYSSAGYANLMLEASTIAVTPLTLATPLTISGASGASTFYSVTVPSGASHLEISARRGTGSVNLFVGRGTLPQRMSAECDATSSGGEEMCYWAAPSPGTYYIVAYGNSAYSGVTLRARLLSITPLTMDAPATISGRDGESTYYSVSVPSGLASLRIATTGGSGALQLRWSRSRLPAMDTSPCAQTSLTSASCLRSAPESGPYVIRVDALDAYSNVQLQVGTMPTTPLTWNTPLTISGADRSVTYYSVTVPAGTPSLEISAAGGTGSVRLQVEINAVPLSSSGTCGGWSEIVSNVCLWSPPTAGTYFIRVTGDSSYSGVQLRAGTTTAPALTSGLAVPISGASGSATLYSFTVPVGFTGLHITTTGGTGDVDLYVSRDRLPVRYQAECSSFGTSTTESCVWETPAPGTYYIVAFGFSAYADVQLQAGPLALTPLPLSTPVTVSGAARSSRFFSVTAPTGMASLEIRTTGGTGNVNLYVSRDAIPTRFNSGCAGFSATNTETCTWVSPTPGTYYILLHGQASYSDVQLQARSVTITPLTLEVPVTISGTAASVSYFSVAAPLGTPGLQITTSGGTGNPDLLAGRDQFPSSRVSDCRSEGPTSSERCRWDTATSGLHYIMVQGQAAYADVQLLATSYQAPRFSVSPWWWTASAEGDTKVITVMASPATAAWEATSSASWLTVSPSSGVGPGQVTLTAAMAEVPGRRTARVTIAGNSIEVTQGTPVEVSLQRSFWDVDASGGISTVGVTAIRAGAAWSASSTASWVTVSPSSGSGSGTIVVTVAPNATSAQDRWTSVRVAGETITVRQGGISPSYSLSHLHWQPPSEGGTRNVLVTAVPADAYWNASTDADWVETTSLGGGLLRLSAAPNQTGSRRTATVTVGDRSLLVTQLPVDVPSGLTVASVVGNTVTLHWQWSGPPPDSYVVMGGLVANQSMGSLQTGSAAPSFTFDGPTGTFFVRVAGLRNGRVLPASENVRVVIGTPEEPTAPANLLGVVSGSGLALSWRNTVSGGMPTSLMLDVAGAVTTSLPLELREQIAVPAVPPGIYEFRLRALNASGSSTTSNAVRLQVPQACRPFDVPDVPNGLQVSRVGNVVTARWNPPVRRSAVSDYVLVISGAASMTLPMTSREISSPAPPGTYTFTVAARNACGTGVFFDPQSITVP